MTAADRPPVAAPFDVEAVRALLAGATPGPWVQIDDAGCVAQLRPPGSGTFGVVDTRRSLAADAALIAAAPTLLAQAVAEVETLRAQIGRVRAEVAKHYQYLPAAVEFYCCGECNRRSSGYVPWPCEVVAVLDSKEVR